MKILCATDLSKASNDACLLGALMARRLDAEVLLTYVIAPSTKTIDLPSHDNFTQGTIEAGVEQQIEQVASEMKACDVKVKTVVKFGQPADILAMLSDEHDIRLLVLGTHARHAPLRWILGSVAESVAARSQCPVLIVRGNTGGLRDWAQQGKHLSTMLALEAEEGANELIEAARMLRQAGPTDITLIQVASTLQVARPGANEFLLRSAHRLERAPGEGAVYSELIPRAGTTAESLTLLDRIEHFNLLVLGTHQRHGLDRVLAGSVSGGVLHAASCPVLLVPIASDLVLPAAVYV
jgi:nucleotide-binding universal stress UspA family protein